MTIHLLITRPAEQADRFVTALQETVQVPLNVIRTPLIKIIPLDVTGINQDPDHVIFTSVNAVAQVARLGLTRRGTAWCVGDRTAQAAHEAGFSAQSASGNGEALLAMIRAANPSGTMLHVHGQHVRLDFAQALGARCTGISAYDQIALPLSAQATTVLGGTDPVIVPLFSPRTATILAKAAITAPAWLIGISDQTRAAVQADLSLVRWEIAQSADLNGMLDATRRVIETL